MVFGLIMAVRSEVSGFVVKAIIAGLGGVTVCLMLMAARRRPRRRDMHAAGRQVSGKEPDEEERNA